MPNQSTSQNPAVTIAKRRIESEQLKIARIVKSFPLTSWLSIPALLAVAVIVSAGALSYSLFNPEYLSPLTMGFLIANISIYFFLLMLTIWFQFSFMKKNVSTMKMRFSQFKAANEKLKKLSIPDFLRSADEKVVNYKQEDAVFPFVFLVSLFSYNGPAGMAQTKLIYELFRDEEEERVSVFIDGSRRFLLWIIRLGIIGTFLGLMTAFVFLGNGLGGIFAEESINFKKAVSIIMEQSLFGYAAAVLSSLGANVASIIYEFFTIRKLQRFNLTDWMSAVFQWYVLSNESQGDLAEEINAMLKSIQRVSGSFQQKVEDLNNAMNDADFYSDFPALLASASNSMKTIGKMADTIGKSIQNKS